MKYLVLCFTLLSTSVFAITLNDLEKTPQEYKLTTGSNIDCPQGFINFQGDRTSVLVGGHVHIGGLNQPAAKRGEAGLKCFLDSESQSCKLKNDLDYYARSVASVSNFSDTDGSGNVKILSSAESWMYKDNIRTLHTKEVVIGDLGMTYKAGVFLVGNREVEVNHDTLKAQKVINCTYSK